MLTKYRAYVAEAFGTFMLVFCGCGAASGKVGSVSIAMAFGLSLALMVYTIGKISGCHVNSAVTLAMYMDGRISLKDAIGYWIGQLVGGLVAALLLLALFGKSSGLGANGLYKDSIVRSLLAEIILTAIFISVVMSVTANKKLERFNGLFIGGALMLVHLIGIGLTGTSVNPTRSLVVAIFAGWDSFKWVWIFIVGPAIGAVVAGVVYRLMHAEEKKAEQAE